METTDVENDENEESILYDLTVHAEWKSETDVFRRAVGKDNVSTISRLASSTQRTGWTVLRSLGLPIQKASPCHLPPNLVRLVNCKINWHIAVGGEGQVAVLQDNCIEIRSNRDDYASVAGRANIQRDPHPQWRQLAWSQDNTMLACSYSSGRVDIFDIVGSLLYTVAGKEVTQNLNQPSDLSEAVAALIFTENKGDKNESSELLIINYHGSLRSYAVDRDNGIELQHSYLFNQRYPRGISCVEHHAETGLLYVGGCGQMDGGVSEPSKEGLTAWRRLSDYPHYKLVTDLSEDLSRSHKARFLKFPSLSYMKADNLDGIFKMSLSPSGRYLATVHYSGKLSLWLVPALKLHKSWPHDQQPFCDEFSPEFTDNPQLRKQVKDLVNTKSVLDINWWSNEAMILARGTGAVTVSSIKSLRNLLGSHPEWFEPAPQLSSMYNGGFLGLEVECRFPTKRRLVSLDETNEEEGEESDQEEAGLVSKSWGVAKQCIHYVTDMDRFKPPKKKPRMINRTYRLVCLKSTTPDELFARKLENEEYGEAKLLAQKYGLDIDLVYQKQWRKSPVELASIQDFLSKISKRAWVLHECTDRMSDKIDAMKALLEFGLRGTDLEALIMIGKGEDQGRFILCDPEDGLYDDASLDDFDPDKEAKMEETRNKKRDELMRQVDFNNLTLEQRELLRARKKLLQYLYRLKTYECILGGVTYAAERYDAKFFENFRSQNIVETAVSYAQDSDWQALETLFTFHSSELSPHRLAILSHFPETTNPTEYKTLLPEVRDNMVIDWDSNSWVQLDWLYIEPCKSALEPFPVDVGEYLYEDQTELRQFRGNITPETVSVWYQYRGKDIEKFSRQTDYALELIKIGIERGVECCQSFDFKAILYGILIQHDNGQRLLDSLGQGLDFTLDDLRTMEMLVYKCHVDESLTFQQLQDKTSFEKLQLIMAQSSDDQYSKNLRGWMVPFLKQCEGRVPGDYNRLLREYIVTTSKTDLNKCVHIFEASKTHLPNPVIIKQADLMSFALESVYSCDRDDQLNLAMNILKCLPQRGYGSDTREIQKLHSLVDKMEDHLNAAKILEENGIKKPVHYIKDTENNADEAEQMMIRLTRMIAKQEDVSEALWSKLHGEMMDLQNKVYRCISPALCHEIFVNGLLCSSNIKYIQLAGRMVERVESESRKPTPIKFNMNTKVSYQRAIELVLSAAREYFNSSANLSDLCIGLARSCLNLIQDSPDDIQEENDLIASLSLLEEFGLTILPLQVRLCSERVELVKNAVKSKPTAYKSKQKLLRLGHLLRIKARDRTDRDDQILHILASAGLKEKDFPFVYESCTQLMTDSHGPAWDVCVDLAMHEDFRNVQAKVDLLSFAVTFCSPDMIEPILQARALLETQVLFEGISTHVDDQSDDQDKRSSHSPFSATAAIQQTQQILTSTKQTTKAVLSTVTDAKWWQGTINRLKQPMQRQVSYDMMDRNKKLEVQSCHPFYADVIENCYCDNDVADFRYMESHTDSSIQMSENLLRTAQLESVLTEGEKSQPATEVLLQLAKYHFCTDNTLSLAYLLALKEPTDAEHCFTEHPKTDISLQLAIYYYALQLYAAMNPCDLPDISPLYLQHPVHVMKGVKNLITKNVSVDWPDYVMDIVEQIKKYTELLEDFTQARVLKNLGRGIDIDRFTSDQEYKQETILGLAMGLEENMYKIAVSLAERHGIPLWDVYAAHVEFLFTDSGLPVEEIETRINKLNVLENLRSRSDEFCDRMRTYVLPSLDGVDHNMMLYYYTLLTGSSIEMEGSLTADQHVKLLKRIRGTLEGLDYKALMDEKVNVIDVLLPCLSSSNITNVAKLAKQIPDRKGDYLDGSVVYCAWAVKYFWEADGKPEPKNTAGWFYRYDQCIEYLQKLQPVHVQKFIDAILFVPKSREKLDIECRQGICKRMLKYVRQQGNKKKKQGKEEESSEITNETLVNTFSSYLKHLETLTLPTIVQLTESEVEIEQKYAEMYDLTMGDTEKIQKLILQIILDGELPLETVHDLLSVIKSKTWTVKTMVRGALNKVLQRWSQADEGVDPSSTVDPLVSLQKIVLHVQEHVENGGDLISSEDVLAKLRPFCSDADVDVQPRLDVLYILEKSFKLSEEDSLLLTLYRTQAIVQPVWHQLEVNEEDITTVEARQQFFQKLLELTVQESTNKGGETEFAALCRLLHLWPRFPITGSDRDSPWILLLNAMVTSGNPNNVCLVIETVEDTENINISKESTEFLFKLLTERSYKLEGVKLCLLAGHKELHSEAIETLADIPQDDDLIILLLKNKLVPNVINTCHYPIIIKYVLASQDEEDTSHDYLNVEILANQLREEGFEAEAGTLLLQDRSTHPLLQTFGSALGSLSKWFK